MKVSAIISLYKSDLYLEDFLYRLSKQTIANETEFIFIVNKDENLKTTKRLFDFEFNKKIINVPLEGIYSSWNRAIKISTCKYLTNMNCDDYHFYDSLEIMSNALDSSDNQTVLCKDGFYSQVYNFINREEFDNLNSEKFDQEISYEVSENRNCGPHPMWKKHIHDEIGLFDENYKSVGDCDMWIRIKNHGKKMIEIKNKKTCFLYCHPSSITKRDDTCEIETKTFYRKYNIKF